MAVMLAKAFSFPEPFPGSLLYFNLPYDKNRQPLPDFIV